MSKDSAHVVRSYWVSPGILSSRDKTIEGLAFDKSQYRGTAFVVRSGNAANLYEANSSILAFVPMSSLGKSFSSATAPVRRDLLLQSSSEAVVGPSPAGIQYSSISQFTQRVELYRGR
jgi:hypothetical protein